MGMLLHLVNPNFAVTKKQEQRLAIVLLLTCIAYTVLVFADPAFAAKSTKTSGSNADAGEILKTIINKVIIPVFVGIGVILAVYAIGQLILAFKNEDADSKSRASQLLVVAIILVAFGTIVQNTGIVNNLTGLTS